MKDIVVILILFFLLWYFLSVSPNPNKKSITVVGKPLIIVPATVTPATVTPATVTPSTVTPSIIPGTSNVILTRTGILGHSVDEYGYVYFPEEYYTPYGKKIRYIMRGPYCNNNKTNPECIKFKAAYCSKPFNKKNMGLCLNNNYLENFVNY
jgi:hypothetical protein